MKVDVTGPVNTNQILSRFTDMFLSRVGLFMTAAHHFPQDLEEELRLLSNEVNGYIFAAKTGGNVDNDSAKEAVRKCKNWTLRCRRGFERSSVEFKVKFRSCSKISEMRTSGCTRARYRAPMSLGVKALRLTEVMH